MNTIKFSPINEERKETHNVEVYDIKPFQLYDESLDVYSNVAFTLYLDAKDNASNYLEVLEQYLIIFQSLKPSMIITGENPTKNKLLLPVLRLLKKYHYTVRSFISNGSGLLDIVEGKLLVQHLCDLGVVHNIEITKGILNQRQLSTIRTFCDVHNMTIRLGHKLEQENLTQLLEEQKVSEEMGFTTTIFRESLNNTNVFVTDFIEEMKQNKNFQFVRTLEGLFYQVAIFYYSSFLIKCYKDETLSQKVIREFSLDVEGDLYLTDCTGNKRRKANERV